MSYYITYENEAWERGHSALNPKHDVLSVWLKHDEKLLEEDLRKMVGWAIDKELELTDRGDSIHWNLWTKGFWINPQAEEFGPEKGPQELSMSDMTNMYEEITLDSLKK